MEETRPICLICGCQKYRSYLEAAIRRFTHPGWVTIGVLGDETLTSAKQEGDLVFLPVRDNYEGLPEKVHAAVAWVCATYPNTCGIWKTDDDIQYAILDDLLFTVNRLKDLPYWGLRKDTCNEAPICWGRVSDRFEDKTLRPRHQRAVYCYGHGYWIGKVAFEKIIAEREEYAKSFGLEDVCTGSIMNKHGWYPESVHIVYREVPRGPELLALQ